MSKRIELNQGEQILYRTATSVGTRFMYHYFLGVFCLPLLGIGLIFLFGWGLAFYSDVVITTQRVMLKKSGLFRSLGGHRSIPLDQIYLGEAWRFTGGGASLESAIARSIQRVELDLLDGKTVHIVVPRSNVFMARLQDAVNA